MFDAKKLKMYLIESDVDQMALAEFAGCSQAYMSRVVNGKQVPSLQVTKSMADFLGMTVDEFLKIAEAV